MVTQPIVRQVGDTRALRALAHPLRVRLYEFVTREATLTTTQASALTGESTASCSFHLRQLAKYGFIERAPSGGGRERPWRRTSDANQFGHLAADPDFAAAAEVAGAIAAEHYVGRLAEFLSKPEEQPSEWRDASFLNDTLLYLTQEELAGLKRDLLELTARYLSRTLRSDERPAGSKPVAVFAAGFPLPPTPTGN